ncbi:hypothetical protein, partial [Amycolatopsis rhizosphaerae]|uniref:hypothetical protein n=1 Tax=Amycolatopsis rhizosphaerae TaxID=2053003 RepID=UPI0016438017
MTDTGASATRDLRKASVDEVLSRVEVGLGVALGRESVVRKRRTVGAPSDRGTWVRIEVRPLAKIAGQGQAANGLEAAELLTGIAKPAWYASLSWHDADEQAIWRADEVELLTDEPLQRGKVREVSLSEAWWARLNASLDALGRQHTTRVATPDTETINHALVARDIERAFPGRVDVSLNEPWVPAHADLAWPNLTWPESWIIDWEDHGMAPRGLDAANLWAHSLGVPGLAARVWRERRADLETRSGRLMALFCCSKVLNDSSIPGELREITPREANRVIVDLERCPPQPRSDDGEAALPAETAPEGAVRAMTKLVGRPGLEPGTYG